MKSVIYARVSSREQAREGFSIPAQIKLLKSYAETKDIKIMKEFVDIETAKKTGRTNFGEMLKFLKKDPSINLLLVEKTDRLYRNIRDWVTLDEIMDEYNLEVHFVKENFILSPNSKSMEKFMHGIKVLMAKNYIDNLSDEIKKGMKEKVLQGGYPHKPPVGYFNKPESREIEVDDEKADYVKRIFEMYATGSYSLAAIRKKCLDDGFVIQPSRSKVSKSSIERILKNEFYIGLFNWKGQKYRGNHKPIISRELFDAVQDKLSSHNRTKEVKHEFVYSGLLTCAHCGCSITAGIQKKKYIYYHCTNFKKNCQPVYVREEILDEQFNNIIQSLSFDEEITNWIGMALKESFEDEKKFHRIAITDLRAKYDKIQARIENIYLDKLDGKITNEFWTQKDTLWREEQKQIQIKMEKHEKADASYMLTGIRTIELTQKASLQYSRLSTEKKRKFLNILLLNSRLDGETLIPEYRQPFDIIAQIGNLKGEKLLETSSISPHLSNWWRWRDLNPRPKWYPQEPLQA